MCGSSFVGSSPAKLHPSGIWSGSCTTRVLRAGERIHACRGCIMTFVAIHLQEHAMSTTILAVDLGKFNSVLCWYEPATRTAAFRTVRTAHEELRQELTRPPVAQVVFEACAL